MPEGWRAHGVGASLARVSGLVTPPSAPAKQRLYSSSSARSSRSSQHQSRLIPVEAKESPSPPRSHPGTSLGIAFLIVAALHPISYPFAMYFYGRGWTPVPEAFYAPQFYARRWIHVPAVQAYFRIADELCFTGVTHGAEGAHSRCYW
jgi:hypothetical protein